MNTIGHHLLVEYHGCDNDILDDAERIERMMRNAAEAAQATVVTATFHRFAPQGVSGVVVIAESHLSIHTWPEYGYAAVDFYTCGDCRPEHGHALIQKVLGAERAEVMTVRRGLDVPGPSMRVTQHYHEGDEQARTAGAAELPAGRSSAAASAQVSAQAARQDS